MTTSPSEHIEFALEQVRTIYQAASDKIENLNGKKVSATGLAADLCKELCLKTVKGKPMQAAQLYPVLKFLFEDYPGLKISRGATGGLEKLHGE